MTALAPLLAMLACPRCDQPLAEAPDGLHCAGCRTDFPGIDSIPWLFAEPNAALGICADFPAPLLSVFPDLREIEVGSSTITMRYEAQGQDVTRVIHLDQAQHPANVAPSVHGHSIGRWEGETLVVDTVAFAPHPIGVWIAVPSGASKHVVERFALAADRRHLRYDLTIEDPAGLTAPASLSSQWEYRPDLTPSGVPCDPEMARRLIER